MVWCKKGIIFTPNTKLYWSKTHAQVPTAEIIDENKIRIYYSSRDLNNRSYISYIEVSAFDPSEILYCLPEPILGLGKLGTFDDSGLMPSSVITISDSLKYLYYTGWNIGSTTPYQNAIGLAVSRDNGESFTRIGDGPILNPSLYEPYFIGTACVTRFSNNWQCWYASCTGWDEIDGIIEPKYHLKYAESQDGITWKRDGKIAIDFIDNYEGGIVKASVYKNNLYYEMWYCYRKIIDYRQNPNNSYKIGYAISYDSINWIRRDNEILFNFCNDDWDRQMMAYPNIIVCNNKKYMFYNGNNFGKMGFGYAEWED